MAPRKKTNSVFFNMFVGEYVLFITKLSTKKIHQTEDHTTEETQPIAIEGFLLDMDEKWFFVGPTFDEVACALKQDDVMEITILKERSPYDSILDDIDTPEDAGDFN